jgi:hypothetical protein
MDRLKERHEALTGSFELDRLERAANEKRRQLWERRELWDRERHLPLA